MSKRGASDSDGAGGGGGGPPRKKYIQDPFQVGPISNLEELEVKTLQFQNQKLSQRLNQRLAIEEDLRQRIDQLEKRQTQDDAVINVIHRYWNQLNEDIRILLQRFDAETGDEGEKDNEHESTKSFLTQLATWHKEELDEKLASRVQVSQRAVAKIIQVFDHMIQRNEKLHQAVHESGEEEEVKEKNGEKEDQEVEGGGEKEEQQEGEEKKKVKVRKGKQDIEKLDEVVKETNQRLIRENKKLHNLNTSLHEKNHFLSLRAAELEERNNAEITKIEELENKLDDMEYELTKCKMKNGKLEMTLSETQETLKLYIEKDGGKGLEQKVVLTNAERKSVEQLQNNLEEERELASNRLIELEKLNTNYKESLREVERLKMELSTLPEHVVVETTEHKCLQSQFSVLYNEAMQLKTQLEDSRNQLQMAKNAHMRQIEQMESEELLAQKKLRTEAIQLEDMLAQVRKEYEMLRIEFEQNLAANEQTGPINKEMRNLISSLQTHSVQLKGEINRYKRKLKEANSDLAKAKKELEEYHNKEIKALQLAKQQQDNVKTEAEEVKMEVEHQVKEEPGVTPMKEEIKSEDEYHNEVTDESSKDEVVEKSPEEIKLSENFEDSPEVGDNKIDTEAKSVNDLKEKVEELAKIHSRDVEVIKDLKNQLKKTSKEMIEMKLLLDMYKASAQEKREKAQIMAAEKKAKSELEEVKIQLKKLSEAKREEKKRMADEDATRRIRQLEDQVANLQRQAQNYKQDEEALLREMDITGEAYEETQEQSNRLIEQVREKDAANIKLMSERIKSNQIQRMAREERDTLVQQVNTLSTQVEAQNLVVRKLEEKERLLQTNLMAMEKELAMRQQAMEMHKRKAIESAQSAADLKLHLEKYHAQIKEVQQTIAEKTSALEAEAFKTKRLQEELALVKRKVERLRKIEMATDTDMDQILKEEVREYKETLTCPSCKVKRKDAVLTKCFHCFCYDCLRTRYETRQRKCPKCNAAFGASDYHRLYLA